MLNEGEKEIQNANTVMQRVGAQLSDITEALPNRSDTSKGIESRFKTCYVLITLGVLTVAVSLAAAIWRSEVMNDFSGGFSLAQYILGIGIFAVGTAVALHAKRCTCWVSWRD